MWHEQAVKFIEFGKPILLVHRGKINEYEGAKSISFGKTTVIRRNPLIPEADSLREWFDKGGANDVINSISAPKYECLSIEEADTKNSGTLDKPYFYQLKGTIKSIAKTTIVYKACVQSNCKRKLLELPNGQYACPRCKLDSANFIFRMKVDVSLILNFPITIKTA